MEFGRPLSEAEDKILFVLMLECSKLLIGKNMYIGKHLFEQHLSVTSGVDC